ncbi:mannose-6-phosphate isomerase class I [Dyadobacter sp. BE34]|uniref:Mannose-6-phosphate isomerase class I n=1 Tax=Dyadobacter fermentans TaxID=94254 RepID=A0ABU1QW09_9BACT|nr:MULTISPECIES: class I mannose-6-phosphate isomerase [Dyadobacter]MDR6804490.1 mannose-6-phosphate isomerase class I [Dyadobacter fermentans]MDR7042230.1 mannose-6-phosphate isomerase class I [Dyadobacter sp. BE242]MDR7196632.1 mannose-6-phosphate isomerase class I [Dyadobacter sp. BE34]MDR7212822.1 mannose-6-phosphate isomerase class I [Dyadobacter sp. BE31]MDR7262039.1 mannose-6-phosphate isomerase class I [Dyadobacter sp. BE32]
MSSNYDKYPFIEVSKSSDKCFVGWANIFGEIARFVQQTGQPKCVVCMDVYHGVDTGPVREAIGRYMPAATVVHTGGALKSVSEIGDMVYPFVTDDQVFGKMNDLEMVDFFDTDELQRVRGQIRAIESGLVIVYGEGAALFADAGLLVYADLARWEIQKRMKRGVVGNFGMDNADDQFALKYKQGYFLDWRVFDRHKLLFFDKIDFFIDACQENEPKMVDAQLYQKGLDEAVRRPFRVVPFFDPGPWGGQWLKKVADLDRGEVNYAWGFDCVPEENSLLFKFGECIFELPSINLVLTRPRQLLGKHVYGLFGAEFPIRFDFLDTMDGGNLSLQVHPTRQYIKEHFGMDYTQDESYYFLEAEEDACVYLGTRRGVKAADMIADLEKAQGGLKDFDAEKYVNKLPVKKHDHILIPAGTIHCSGKNAVVLEISATPYIFTFKLWDWGRLGLDGKPRPINIEHGKNVIDWGRDEDWVKENLFNNVEQISVNGHSMEESTGLFNTQFIETRRHWFDSKVTHYTNGNLNVVNLVEGDEAVVESPDGLFEPYVIHYAETFIVPADVPSYTITPSGKSTGKKCATLKAYVRK